MISTFSDYFKEVLSYVGLSDMSVSVFQEESSVNYRLILEKRLDLDNFGKDQLLQVRERFQDQLENSIAFQNLLQEKQHEIDKLDRIIEGLNKELQQTTQHNAELMKYKEFYDMQKGLK